MRRLVVLLSVTGSLVAAPLVAQDTTPAPKPPDSTHIDSVPPPTADQLKWMEGLRTAARGIGQLKSGIENVQRAETSPTQLKRAGKLLAGFCGTGRGFMHTGVARMSATAYPPGDNRKIAQQVVIQIDSVAKETTNCERTAAKDPKTSVQHLTPLLMSYEASIAAWRAMVGLPAIPTRNTKP